MSIFAELDNKNNKGGIFAELDKKSAPKETITQKVGRIASPIADTLGKLPARMATNVAQTVQGVSKLPEIIKTGKATFTPIQYSDINKKVPILSQKTAETVKPFELRPESFKSDIKDIAGGALETLSYLPFARAATTGLKAGKAALGQLAKEGAIGGFTGVAGQQMQQGGQFDAKQLAMGTGLGAAAGPVLGILGRGINKAFSGKKGTQLVDEVLTEVAPKLSKEERYAQYLASQGYEPIPNPNTLPEIKMGPKAKPSTPIIEYGKTQPNVITPEVTQVGTKIPATNMINSPEDVDRALTGIIREGKNAPELAEQAVKEATSPAPVAKPISQEVFMKADDIVEKMPESSIMNPFERQTNVEQISRILEKPQDEIIDIIKGNKPLPDNIPRDAYLAVAKNIADETNDTKLALDLLPYTREISSKTGQGLQATKIAKADNLVDVLDDVQKQRFNSMSQDAQLRYNKDLDEAVQLVQKEFGRLKGLPNTREQMVKALLELKC